VKHIIILFLLIPVLCFPQITEDLSTESPHANKKLYAKGALVFGPGFESIKVGEKYYENSDRDPQDIDIMPGGGAGVEAVIGYDITKSLSAEFSIGTQNSGSFVDEDNKAQFKKSLIRASVYYKIPIEKKFTPYIGAGISNVLSAKYVENSQGFEFETTYTKPSGFHIIGGAEWKTPNSPWFWYGEARFIILGEFEADESDVNTWILEEVGIDKMNGNGLQFSFGVGYFIL